MALEHIVKHPGLLLETDHSGLHRQYDESL